MNLAFLSLIFLVCSQQIDFHASENQQLQHTSSYRVPKEILVLRRATNFSLSFSGSVPSGFRLQAVDPFSRKPSSSIIRIPVQSSSNPKIWQAVTENNKDFIVNVPPTASVFIYSFAIEYADKVVPTNQFIVFLFNPFSESDAAYLPDAEDQMEYVLNEQGAMWLSVGRGSGWTWDHFSQDVLEVTLWLLQGIDHDSRGDLNIVSRFLTSVMNANNGKGLMYGRWREPYSDGKEPWKWTGSGEIFSQYRKIQNPVRYGQCWVFAGVLVSAGRSLGIPARQITNFNSAHEDSGYGPYRLSIDFLTPSDGSEDKSIGSIWNFHAWSEFWFARSDLKTGEWQVVDATPQETSDGKYQMGPASQLSVRNQSLDDKWDTRFVASETNAAIRQYVQFKTGKPEHPFMKGYYLAEEQINACGRDITTKAKGSDSAEDITNQYKFKQTLLRHQPLLQTMAKEDHDFVFYVNQSAYVVMGSGLFLNLTVQCPLCSESLVRNIDIQCRIAILAQNGQTIATFKNPNGKYIVDSPHVFRFSFPLSASQYQPYLMDADLLQSSLLVQVTDQEGNTTQYFSQLKRYEIDAPPLDLVINNSTENSFGVDIKVLNPLSIPLTNVSLSISGANIIGFDTRLGRIPQNHEATYGPLHIVLPNGWTEKGWVTLYAKVTSDQIPKMDVLAVVFRNGKLLYK